MEQAHEVVAGQASQVVGGPVGRAVVDDDDVFLQAQHRRLPDTPEDLCNRRPLVEHRHDDGNGLHRGTRGAPLVRAGQPAVPGRALTPSAADPACRGDRPRRG